MLLALIAGCAADGSGLSPEALLRRADLTSGAGLDEPLESRYAALPFVTKPAFELDGYVADRALGGLFALLAREERRIREDPAARSSDLLRRVFAGSH